MTDLDSLSDEERATYLRSLPLDRLLDLARVKRRPAPDDGPAWKRLDRFH